MAQYGIQGETGGAHLRAVVWRRLSGIWNKDAARVDWLFMRGTDLSSKYIKANGSQISVRERYYKLKKKGGREKTRIRLKLDVLVYNFQFSIYVKKYTMCACMHLHLLL